MGSFRSGRNPSVYRLGKPTLVTEGVPASPPVLTNEIVIVSIMILIGGLLAYVPTRPAP